ncbi:50S ribosomal protein L25/general stress protein Ctc [Anaerocellum diazotrophicum]|uniref:Large ribosomal subunit protein bL25 n=1 Tax=Caldicellulosiruptor diazotrophicus TaxID=2806205 RepID=A0ABM7NMG8_9FIRM|nr:50S ribosomal protein L25/general stress protein Ctc [Caldicellulosiruptor diazotrophicus]BCS81301.1 50S ribosomal protein L25 [Caldicellulosiruptor diazotrophicus]
MEPVLVYNRRDVFTKSNLNKLRKEGYIPAVAYGNDIKSLPGYVSKKEFEKLYHQKGLAGKIKIFIDGKERTALIKEVQIHYTKGNIIHVDFQILSENKPIYVEVPIIFENAEILKSRGLVLQRQMDTVEIEGLPKDIPEHLVINLMEYEKPTAIKLRDIKLPEGIKITEDLDEVVAVIDISEITEEPEIEEKKEETSSNA